MALRALYRLASNGCGLRRVGLLGDDDERTGTGCLFAQGAGIVALVAQEHAAGRRHAQQVWCDGDVGDVAGAEQEGARSSLPIRYGVDLGRAAARERPIAWTAAPLFRLLRRAVP